jgi:hypothetical protein
MICILDGQPVQVPDYSVCSHVTMTGQEYKSLIEKSGASHSPFEMSRQDAAHLGVAIATIWIAVGVVKLIFDRI